MKLCRKIGKKLKKLKKLLITDFVDLSQVLTCGIIEFSRRAKPHVDAKRILKTAWRGFGKMPYETGAGIYQCILLLNCTRLC